MEMEIVHKHLQQQTVDSICVYVTRTDLDKSIAPTNCPYVLLDKDGNKLTPKEITGNYDTVSVSMPVLMNKDLPLTVSLVGGAGATDNSFLYLMKKHLK